MSATFVGLLQESKNEKIYIILYPMHGNGAQSTTTAVKSLAIVVCKFAIIGGSVISSLVGQSAPLLALTRITGSVNTRCTEFSVCALCCGSHSLPALQSCCASALQCIPLLRQTHTIPLTTTDCLLVLFTAQCSVLF